MFLKKLFWKSGLRDENLYYFFVGFFYSVVGIVLSRAIFSQNIGLAAVFFISLAAISEVDRKLSLSERILGTTRFIGTKILYMEEIVVMQHHVTLQSVFDDHKNLFKTYFFLFMGILFCFSAVTLLLPQEESAALFGEQFKIISGSAFEPDLLQKILENNLVVLITTFFVALVFEYGTTFIIVWNASVWGTAFALAAKKSFLIDLGDPLINFAALILLVLTYLPFEATGYFASSISGGLLNKAIVREKIGSKRFELIAMHIAIILGFGLIMLGLSALIEVFIIDWVR